MRGKWNRYRTVRRYIAPMNLDRGKGNISKVILVRLFELIFRTIGASFGAVDADMNNESCGARLCGYGKCKI